LLVVLAAVGLSFVRPHLMHPRYAVDDPAARDVVALQAHLGLPADGPRTYAEHSMHWLAWWLGPTGLVLAVVGVALLRRRVLQGRYDDALPFVLVLLGTAAVVLVRPSITPDHPWADRRFVPVVLPGLITAAAWLVALAVRWTRERARRTTSLVVALAGVAAMLVPALVATYPLLGRSTERGEIAAVHHVCTSLPPRAAVLVAGGRAAQEWTQVIRGECDVPVAVVDAPDLALAVHAAATSALENGWHPVVIADTEQAAAQAAETSPRHVVHLLTREADHQLTRRPKQTRAFTFDIWAADAH
jgi:hypothetical protein